MLHFRSLLKRNPPLSRNAVTQLVSPTLFFWFALCSLCFSPGVVVLIHVGLTFSLAHRNTKWKQFLKIQWNPNSFQSYEMRRTGDTEARGCVFSCRAVQRGSAGAVARGRRWVRSCTAGTAGPVRWMEWEDGIFR